MEAANGSGVQAGNKPMGKFIWTMSLLILTSWVLNRLGMALLLNVWRRGELTTYWPALLVRQTFLIAMTLLSAELAVVLYFYRPLRNLFTLPAESDSANHIRHKLRVGVVGGVCAFLVSIPLLFVGDPVHMITPQLLSYPVSFSVVCQLGLLLIVVPVMSELVFRGIAFKTLLDASSLWPAVIGSALLFAYVWPVPNVPVAVVLGIASALVFCKARTLVSSILTNATLAILAETFFLLRGRLHFF